MTIRNGTITGAYAKSDNNNTHPALTIEESCGAIALESLNLEASDDDSSMVTINAGNTVTIRNAMLNFMEINGGDVTVEYASFYSNDAYSNSTDPDALLYVASGSLAIEDGYFYRSYSLSYYSGSSSTQYLVKSPLHLIQAESGATLNISGGYFAASFCKNGKGDIQRDWNVQNNSLNNFYNNSAGNTNESQEGTFTIVPIRYAYGQGYIFAEVSAPSAVPFSYSSSVKWYALGGSAAPTQSAYWLINGSQYETSKTPEWNANNTSYEMLGNVTINPSDPSNKLTIGNGNSKVTVDLGGYTFTRSTGNDAQDVTVSLTNVALKNVRIGLPFATNKNDSITVSGASTICADAILEARSITLAADTIIQPGARFATYQTANALDTTKTYSNEAGNTVVLREIPYNPSPGWPGSVTLQGNYYVAVLPLEETARVEVTFYPNYPSDSTSTAPDAGSQTLNPGDKLQPTSFNPPTGYSLLGWNTAANGSGTWVDGDTSYTASLGNAFYAIWQRVNVAVTFDAGDGSLASGSLKERTIPWGAALGTLPGASRAGYSLTGWYTAQTDGEQVASNTKVQPTSAEMAVIYYARWQGAEAWPIP